MKADRLFGLLEYQRLRGLITNTDWTRSSPVSIGCSRPCSGRPYGWRAGCDDG
jgi:hypothetical protein